MDKRKTYGAPLFRAGRFSHAAKGEGIERGFFAILRIRYYFYVAREAAAPLCSRKSRCAAIFRESAFLYFIINICAFENLVSQKVPSICRILTAFAGKVNVEVF